MKININGIFIDDYSLNIERVCHDKACLKTYRIIEYYEGSEARFYPPYNYVQGCSSYCLECWLDVSQFMNKLEENKKNYELDLSFPVDHSNWYAEENFQEIDLGNLEVTYKEYTEAGSHVVLLPLSRFVTDKSIFLPCGVMIYPEGRLELSNLDLSSSDDQLATIQSLMSGVKLEDYNAQPLIALPININWDSLLACSHMQHMELIRTLSEMIDALCLDYIRYTHCKLTYIPDEGLPNSAGQIASNSMMSSALFMRNGSREAKLIGGAAFTHTITRGVGLVARQPEWDRFPRSGEMGNLALRAISQYSQILKTESATSRFVQSLSLLEFLAFPYEYKNFKKVKSVISRSVAKEPTERKKILDRFEYLTGKIDEDTGEQIGLRTRIVHIGARFEDLVNLASERRDLFDELDLYIRIMINDMIEFSHISFDDYEKLRSER